jgi:DNA-binding IclR family transcriptional regulator
VWGFFVWRQTVSGHRTINRVTQILEEVVYRPGQTYAEITRAVDAPKSSIYGFIKGLLEVGWLFEQDKKLYLGPAFHSLAIVSGQIRAGFVTTADVDELHQDTGLSVLMGVQVGDSLMYVAEAGSDLLDSFGMRSDIRRPLLSTAGGRALLAALPDREIEAFLRGRAADEQDDVDAFLRERARIRESGIAVMTHPTRARTAIAAPARDASGRLVGVVTLAGPTDEMEDRIEELSDRLKQRVQTWRGRSGSLSREAV